MIRPVQITFRNIAASPALEDEIHARAARLDTFYTGIIGCRVLLDIPHRHRKHARPLRIRIELSLPGEDVIVNHELTLHTPARQTPYTGEQPDDQHTDVRVALHEAFDVARRRLEDVARRQRGDVKTRVIVD